MARPHKKVSVTPEGRRKWLQRHEEYGESAPEIAEKDQYDVRTVRKQLDLAREEKESRESRLMVLREAAQAHYGDLCKRAAEIESALSGKGFGAIETKDRMGMALRQHLPRAPLWKYIDQWNAGQETLDRVKSDIKDRLKEMVPRNAGLSKAFSAGKMNVDNFVDVMEFQLNSRSRGASGLDRSNLRTEPFEGDKVYFRYGAWSVGAGKAEQKAKLWDAISAFEKEIAKLEELQRLTEAVKYFGPLREKIEEELATITLRRVLPGRCKYCPI